MKTKIAILGSTGSIGKSLLKIISKDKNNFEIVLLTANKNSKLLLRQAKIFKVKNLIINDKKTFESTCLNKKESDINIYNNFDCYKKLFPKKIDYVMSSIVGLDGLFPTIDIIKHTKKIAIANKESIICAWNLISKELNKYKTNFIPVDSEHFSLWFAMKNINSKSIKKIILTASGGPFLNLSKNNFKKIKLIDAINHPTWKMGNKISIDSATLINKVYEVIEARNIFNMPLDKIEIIIHPKSYVHAIIEFNNGLIKIIAHETDMKIPIYNTLYFGTNKKIKSRQLNITALNDLNLSKVDKIKFPMIKLLNILPKKLSLFETAIVSANDTLVNLYLEQKIKFIDIQKKLFSILKDKKINLYKNKYPKNFSDIINLNNYLRFKIIKNSYKLNK